MEKTSKAKHPITILLTPGQIKKIRNEAKQTGNSQNSIIRTAIEIYFKMKEEGLIK